MEVIINITLKNGGVTSVLTAWLAVFGKTCFSWAIADASLRVLDPQTSHCIFSSVFLSIFCMFHVGHDI